MAANLPQCLNVVGTVGTTSEIGQVKLNLIPAFIESHRHGADEGLDARRRLVVGGTESTPNVLVIQNLNLEGKVLIHVLEDHHQEGKLDAQGLFGIGWTDNVVRRYIRSHDLHNRALNVRIGNALHVTILHGGVPYLQRFGSVGGLRVLRRSIG